MTALWREKWMILVVGGLAMFVLWAISLKKPNEQLANCAANGGRLVAAWPEGHRPEPHGRGGGGFKSPPLICKYD